MAQNDEQLNDEEIKQLAEQLAQQIKKTCEEEGKPIEECVKTLIGLYIIFKVLKTLLELKMISLKVDRIMEMIENGKS